MSVGSPGQKWLCTEARSGPAIYQGRFYWWAAQALIPQYAILATTTLALNSDMSSLQASKHTMLKTNFKFAAWSEHHMVRKRNMTGCSINVLVQLQFIMVVVKYAALIQSHSSKNKENSLPQLLCIA